jgi:hypothetical protein
MLIEQWYISVRNAMLVVGGNETIKIVAGGHVHSLYCRRKIERNSKYVQMTKLILRKP